MVRRPLPVLVLFCSLAMSCTRKPDRLDSIRSTSPLGASQVPTTTARGGGSCGALSYGIHHRQGDTINHIEARRAGTVPCATPCDPKPSFATGGLGRNEHGGYSFIAVDPRYCQFESMDLPIAECGAVCEKQDLLGKLSISLASHDETARATLCRAFEARRGPPTVGSCDCLKDDIVWLPSDSEAGIVLHFMGTYTLDCGFPDGNYVPRARPD